MSISGATLPGESARDLAVGRSSRLPDEARGPEPIGSAGEARTSPAPFHGAPMSTSADGVRPMNRTSRRCSAGVRGGSAIEIEKLPRSDGDAIDPHPSTRSFVTSRSRHSTAPSAKHEIGIRASPSQTGTARQKRSALMEYVTSSLPPASRRTPIALAVRAPARPRTGAR